ncbi:MAG: LamG domain-containing protein, partial [Cytophagales bacterium]|nr:LamG domain-containing protein [Cytophagales bacterium]
TAFVPFPNTSQNVMSTYQPTTNIWLHYVFTFDPTLKTLKIYLNGVLNNSLTYTGASPAGIFNKMVIGREYDGGGNGYDNTYFKGALDDLKIYNKVLSAVEVQQLFNEPAPCPVSPIPVSKCPQALDFNQPATGQHVDLGTDFNVPNTFTVQSWVKLHSTTSTGFYYVVSKHISASYLGSYALYISNRIPTFYITGVGNVAFSTTGTVALDNNWHHLAGTYDGSVLRLYIDGVLNSSANVTWNVNQSTVPVHFGASDYATGAYPPSFDGIMDEVAIFNKTLTQSEIQTFKNSGVPSTTPGLAGYWKFEETDPLICYNTASGGANGTIVGNAMKTNDTPFATSLDCGLVAWYPFCGNANDVSGNNHNGTVVGANLSTDRFGNANGAYYFNRIPSNPNYILSPAPYFSKKMSVSYWMKPDSDVLTVAYPSGFSFQPDLSALYTTAFASHLLGQGYPTGDLGKINSCNYSPINQQTCMKSNAALSLGSWHHIAYTYDASNVISLYVDGTFITSAPVIGNDLKVYNYLFFGRDNLLPGCDDCQFKGALDDYRVYNRLLTPSEISQLYNAPSTCSTSGLVASYPFCGNANDISGYNRHGTVIGATLTTDRFGNLNNAYSFNGLNNTITFTGVPTNKTDNWAISAWISPGSLNQAGIAISNGYDDIVNAPICNGYSFGVGGTGFVPGANLMGLYSNISFYNTGYTFSST